MISNIHFEKTRGGSWVLEGRSVQTVRRISLTHKIWNSTLGCASFSFENRNYTYNTWLTRSWVHRDEIWSSFYMVFGGCHHFAHNQLRWEISIKVASMDFTQQATTQKAPPRTNFCTTRFYERYPPHTTRMRIRLPLWTSITHPFIHCKKKAATLRIWHHQILWTTSTCFDEFGEQPYHEKKMTTSCHFEDISGSSFRTCSI